jgi:hypothetical protein
MEGSKCSYAMALLAIDGTTQAAVLLRILRIPLTSRSVVVGPRTGNLRLEGIPAFPSYFQPGTSSQSGTIFYGAVAREYMGAPAATVTIALPNLSDYTNPADAGSRCSCRVYMGKLPQRQSTSSGHRDLPRSSTVMLMPDASRSRRSR